MPESGFYESLPVLDDFTQVTRLEHFTPLPNDWLIIASESPIPGKPLMTVNTKK